MKSFWWVAWVLLGILASCRGETKALDAGQAFVPPAQQTAAPVPRRTPAATPSPRPRQAPSPSAAPACTNQLRFLQDETIPDGTEVSPGQVLDKRWRVRNAGTCNWDGRYRLKHVGGERMGAPAEVALFPARAGTEVVLRLVLKAPAQPGQYFSTWQAYDPQGQPFGDPIYLQVTVVRPKPTAMP